MTKVLLILLVVAVVAFIGILFLYSKQKIAYKKLKENHENDVCWYESILDSIPYPLSVTDNNMNWTFVNKPVEQLFNQKRSDFIGKPCNNWGAKICNTQQCGITCLKNGKCQTFFEQFDKDYQVDVNYLYDANGNKVGHVEVVQDITTITEIQKKQDKLIKTVDEICNSIIGLTEASDKNAQKLALGSDEQSAAVEELVATMNQIDSKTQTNADALKETTEKTRQADAELRHSNQQMLNLIDAMQKIDETSQQINMIITSIEDIAAQTNLLSLNASIEAARAGEAGRGFAVVADQIGKLASQSTQAAVDTKKLIETTIVAIHNGDEITRETASSLETVVSSMTDIQNYSSEISSAITLEASAISQVNQTLEQIATVVQENSVIAYDNSNTTEELLKQIELLKNTVNTENN